MKFRNTVQLGALLVFLIIVFFGWQKLQTRSEQMAAEAKRLFSFELADVRKLTIHRLDETPTTGIREGEAQWTITEPNPSIKPNVTLWERVAAQATLLMNERTLPEGAVSLEAYGLAVPRLTIGLEADGAEHTLLFGYLEPTQTYRYARLDDGPVFLVKKDVVFELDRPLDLLREAFVVDNHLDPIYRFEFAPIMTAPQYEEQLKLMDNPPPVGTEADNPIIVERSTPEVPWTQISPVRSAANQEKVNELVNEIQHARGTHFVDAPESYADYGLEPGIARISIENAEGGGGRQTFYFGDLATVGDVGGIWARKEGEPAVFLLDGHITTLFPRMNALRERRLLARPIGEHTTLEYIGRDHRFTLTRNPEKELAWEMVEPALDDTDELFVTQYIAALKSLEGIQFFEGGPADYGLDNAEVTLRFSGAPGAEPAEIRLTPDPQDPSRYYALTDAGEVTAVPAEHVAFVPGDAQRFRLMSLAQFSPNRVTAMDFQIDGVDYSLRKEHNRWLVTAPENHFMPNQRDALSLLQAVVTLRAVAVEEVTEAEEPGGFGFDAPRFTFRATLAPEVVGGAEETVGPLEIGGVVPGIDDQRFARSAARGGVFRVKQSFIETVSASVMGIRPQSSSVPASN